MSWSFREIQQLCKITRGASPRPIQNWMTEREDGIPWIKISDATSSGGRTIERTAGRILREGEEKSVSVYEGDLILSNSATPGIPKFVGIHACIHDGWLLLREFKDTVPEFLFYLLKHERRNLVAQGNGSVFTNLKTDILKNHQVSVPPLTEQKAIAHILGALDDKIELNQKMNQTLEEIAKAIFKSWFVDFDPVRAKAEGRPTGLPPEISDLFPDELVDSENGEIPKAWELQPLSKQIKVNPKYVLKKGTDAYFVEMKCLSESTSSVSEGYVRSFTSGSKFWRFDTLFARITPCLENGKTGLLLNKSASDVCWGSTEFIVLSPQDDQSPLFPYCWARSENLRTAAVSSMTGSSGRQRVPNDFFDSYLVANPNSKLHQTFQKIADPIIDRIQVCNEEMSTLSELRDTLLPKLISGELRIPDAEKFLEEAGI